MKVNIVLLFVLVTLIFSISSCKKNSSSSDVNLTNGLVAYYPFNGNANDASGNGLNGNINGGVTFSNDIAGNLNSAATFDGSTGYILVSDNAGKFQTSAVSISFLVNLTNTSVRQSFVASQNFTDGTGLSYAVIMSTPNTSLLQFGVEYNTLGCGAPPYDPSTIISSANQMSANKWYHVVAIFSDSLQEIFVNGTLNTAITRNFCNA
jgi:hypothetical protein